MKPEPKNQRPAWADEPAPLCDDELLSLYDETETRRIAVDADFACDLERRLRHALKLVGKLRADSECGDFDEDDLEQRLTRIEETLTP